MVARMKLQRDPFGSAAARLLLIQPRFVPLSQQSIERLALTRVRHVAVREMQDLDFLPTVLGLSAPLTREKGAKRLQTTRPERAKSG
jgi:hypothetical protein